MTILTEIADKMPSTLEVVAGATLLAAACAGVAMINRLVAWSLLGITVLIGAVLTYAAATEAFGSGDLGNCIWAELGWPWVLATLVGPLLPAVCVMCVLFIPRSNSGRHGFPIDAVGS